jgi:hypothetical protein
LLMGVTDSLRIDKTKFTRDKKTGNITQVSVSGGFSVDDLIDVDLVTNDLDITIGSQTFTIKADRFKFNNGKYTCSNINVYDDSSHRIGIAASTFDFNKCTFMLKIKNTNFTASTGEKDFKVEFGDFSEGASVSLP